MSQELERALLDDRMELFKAEIELKLARFRCHKERLLSLLFHNSNGRRPSEGATNAWSALEAIAYQYLAREILKQTVISNADRAAPYRAIANASQRTKSKIEKEVRADPAGYLMKCWLDGTKKLGDATEEFQQQIYMEAGFQRKVDKALAILSELEAAANQRVKEVHKAAGRPQGTSILPWQYILALEAAYRESTGLEPVRGPGSFADFVEEFLIAVGRTANTARDYVVERVRKTPEKD
jgi:hypothetical protein